MEIGCQSLKLKKKTVNNEPRANLVDFYLKKLPMISSTVDLIRFAAPSGKQKSQAIIATLAEPTKLRFLYESVNNQTLEIPTFRKVDSKAHNGEAKKYC